MTNAVAIAQVGSNNTTFRNRIINGAMTIDQRNAGASGTNSSSYTVDRFAYYGSQASKGTWGQNLGSVTPPAGFTNYLGFTSSSAYTVGSAEVFYFYQPIEGYNIADLNWGSANAKTVTLSFWVRSSLTGTFGGALRNSDVTRSYPFNYTISSANTWEQKTITIVGDTTGTWLTTNGVGIYLDLSLGAGSTLLTTPNAWVAGSYVAGTGATSVVGTNGATFYITGVQLEAGSAASPFENRSYGTEFSLCQRYYWKASLYLNTNIGVYGYPSWTFPVNMRTQPTMTSSAGSGSVASFTDGNSFAQIGNASAAGTTSNITASAEL